MEWDNTVYDPLHKFFRISCVGVFAHEPTCEEKGLSHFHATALSYHTNFIGEGFSTTNKSGKLDFPGIEELCLMSRLLPRSLFFTNKRNNGTHIPQPYEVCVIDRRNSPVIIVDAQHLVFNDVQFAVAKLEGYVHNDW